MSQGIPSIFSTTLSTIFKWMLATLFLVIVLSFFATQFSWLNQNKIKETIFSAQNKSKADNKGEYKSKYDFDILNPGTWTYEAMIERNKENNLSNKNTSNKKSNIVKPIILPRINNYTNKNTANTNNEWYVDGSVWSK